METLSILPELQGRRFGSVAVGYDRIDTIRAEFATLLGLAAIVCGVERDKVTVRMVEALTSVLTNGAAVATPSRLKAVVETLELPMDSKLASEVVLAMGVALARTDISTVDTPT